MSKIEDRLLTAERLTEILKEKMSLDDFISLSNYPNHEVVGKALTFAVGGQRDLTAELVAREIFKDTAQLHVAHREMLCEVGEWAEGQGVGVFVYFTREQWQALDR